MFGLVIVCLAMLGLVTLVNLVLFVGQHYYKQIRDLNSFIAHLFLNYKIYQLNISL